MRKGRKIGIIAERRIEGAGNWGDEN